MTIQSVISVPSARRLITSLRDLGYGFVDAVAEMIDNSIEAGANFIQVGVTFNGDDSYLLVMDNGRGMTSLEIQEAMKFGSTRKYDRYDLGRFGLGLKTASLSQCDELIVSSRQGLQRARINSFMWSMNHINKSDRWEILKVQSDVLPPEVLSHLGNTVGTAVCWRKLSRLMGYRWPTGKHAEREAKRIVSDLRMGLGATFHRFLSGEVVGKRIGIFVNGEPVEPWDPFCRANDKTDALALFQVPMSWGERNEVIVFHPFVLPISKSFSSPQEFIRAGGLRKWNKQQGFYIYRAGRLIQAGGWSGLRTADEHTKLVRVAVDIPPYMDEAFKVNISKMRVSIPREVREKILDHLATVIKIGQEKYRANSHDILTKVTFGIDQKQLDHFASEFGFDAGRLEKFLTAIADAMGPIERMTLLRGLRRYFNQSCETTVSKNRVA